jgi:predicted nucleic acid-binding protein
MKFWDASAIVPLLLAEARREALLDLLQADPAMVVWWGTPVECGCAIARREREGALDLPHGTNALSRLRSLGKSWSEVIASDAVRSAALRLLRTHPLRAADSLQLAAAIVAAEGDPASLPFVCLDERLREAADREGFPTLPD